MSYSIFCTFEIIYFFFFWRTMPVSSSFIVFINLQLLPSSSGILVHLEFIRSLLSYYLLLCDPNTLNCSWVYPYLLFQFSIFVHVRTWKSPTYQFVSSSCLTCILPETGSFLYLHETLRCHCFWTTASIFMESFFLKLYFTVRIRICILILRCLVSASCVFVHLSSF